MRAYYTTHVHFDDFTNSSTTLEVITTMEHATSIIVASTPVCAPVLHKWLHGGFYFLNKRSREHGSVSKRSFLKMRDDRDYMAAEQIELGQTRTKVEGPDWADKYLRHGALGENDLEGRGREIDRQRVVNEGITVEREFEVQRDLRL